jgi:putative tryptophan/tyrosine transport system substrate-binding protein
MIARRTFIAGLGTAAAWSLAAQGQQAVQKMPTIGFLGSSAPGKDSEAFFQRLRELGWTQGRNVKIEVRWAEGRIERFAEIAAEFVRLKVDVIVTSGGAVSMTMRATSTIPIIFTSAIDPVASGYVTSLARPAGNVTGLSQQATDTAGKRLQLLHELLPDLQRLAILTNASNPGNTLETKEVQERAHALGIDVITFEVGQARDIQLAFDAFKEKAQALYVVTSPLTAANRVGINTRTLGARLPAIYSEQQFVEIGGLMSYGVDLPNLYRRAADYVDKVLRGANPSDLPVEQPTKFELSINLTTAEVLGLTIPDQWLATADEVIE